MEDEVRVKKKKRYDHIPVRPQIFKMFRKYRGAEMKSDNAFVIELLRVYKLYRKHKRGTQ